uniref:C2H2-type domain-containing protein n=1 Tax=Nothoprocta perdicaria TaxID=30464 RepID=A0A8C6Z4W4_NOTPE
MASGCAPPFGDAAEVREGFLCPLCLQDLQSLRQLQAHYEEQHQGEERAVPLIISVSLCWTLSRSSTSLLYWGAQNCTQYSRCGLSRAE